eukprot:scaffold1299_cov385-Pavlova_lutheri.AAC.22
MVTVGWSMHCWMVAAAEWLPLLDGRCTTGWALHCWMVNGQLQPQSCPVTVHLPPSTYFCTPA